MDPISFDGQVAVITGAAGGLGRAYALELARRGASVVVNDLGVAVDGGQADHTPTSQLAKEITEAGGRAVASTDSVADPVGGEAIVDCALANYGRVDIVINNAGTLRDRSFAKAP